MSTLPEKAAFTLSGKFAELKGSDAPRYLTLDAMLAHPDTKVVEEPYLYEHRIAQMTVLPFRALLEALTFTEDADAVVIRCRDGWMNYYTEEILNKFEPFIVLLIDGEPPETWPIEPSMRDHLYPFYIHISAVTYPEFFTERQYGMMNPSAATQIEAVNFDDYFNALSASPYASIQSDTAEYAGRKRFLNNCMSCHQGPGNVGGKKSDRPFSVLKAHARFNAEYFKNYVRNPKSLNPASQMVGHPHFTDSELDEIIAFLKLGDI